ncbi:hypothetical protein [Streptomyces tanashiensis]|uniref:hypothetical protein n=1 Tax=Streptomyces tanashiensis TaxID=67367 RepID=UPI0033C951D9
MYSRVRRHATGLTTATAIAAGALAGATGAQADDLTDLSNPAAVTRAQDYSCGPVLGSDQALADQLNPALTGKLRGYMTPYRLSCARAIVSAVRSRGLSERAAVIAVTTAIVESTLRNNPVEEDHDSVGLFQQRASWGSFENRMNPTWSTNAFLDAMLTVNNWETRQIGDVCQTVQRSAFPERYQPEAGDAGRIVAVLFQPDPGPENVGIYRPSTHEFHLRLDDGQLRKIGWGTVGDRPVAGNWDGQGPENVGIYRPSTHTFHLRMDNGTEKQISWGSTGDIPISGNWDGGTNENVGVYRPTNHTFYLRADDGTLLTETPWGDDGDIPVSGNWDGGHADNFGIYRPSTHEFHLRMDDGTLKKVGWGTTGDLPVVGDWDGTSPDNLGIYRPGAHQFHLRAADGSLLKQLTWGDDGDIPLSGNWDAPQ